MGLYAIFMYLYQIEYVTAAEEVNNSEAFFATYHCLRHSVKLISEEKSQNLYFD